MNLILIIKNIRKMNLSDRQINDIKSTFEKFAGEPVIVEEIGSAVYGYCSELGTLRILKHYRKADNFKADYSRNIKRFYVRIELS